MEYFISYPADFLEAAKGKKFFDISTGDLYKHESGCAENEKLMLILGVKLLSSINGDHRLFLSTLQEGRVKYLEVDYIAFSRRHKLISK